MVVCPVGQKLTLSAARTTFVPEGPMHGSAGIAVQVPREDTTGHDGLTRIDIGDTDVCRVPGGPPRKLGSAGYLTRALV
jgi:hypothetical protein